MKFNAHVVGGSVAGLLMATTAQIAGFTSATRELLLEYLKNPGTLSGDIPILGGLFLTTLVMSLFPDLDSASVVQKWFYRFVMLLLLVLFLTGQMGMFAAIALIALLPLLDKHRGWTHFKITPLCLVFFFAVVVELHRSTQSWFGGFSLSNVISLIQNSWMFAVACILGHYTHLLLDWKLRL